MITEVELTKLAYMTATIHHEGNLLAEGFMDTTIASYVTFKYILERPLPPEEEKVFVAMARELELDFKRNEADYQKFWQQANDVTFDYVMAMRKQG